MCSIILVTLTLKFDFMANYVFPNNYRVEIRNMSLSEFTMCWELIHEYNLHKVDILSCSNNGIRYAIIKSFNNDTFLFAVDFVIIAIIPWE